MMSKQLSIIHPVDETTDFLCEIYDHLSSESFNLLRIATRQDHSLFFENPPKEDVVLFLGHGTSTALNGAMTSAYEHKIFISETQLTVFEGKDVILFSCRSDQYIRKFFNSSKLRTAIGFPNMITDKDEIEHYEDPERAEGLTKDDIEIFRKILVTIMAGSLKDFIEKDLSVIEFLNRIIIRTNVAIIKLFKNPNLNPPLGKMLLDFRKGLMMKR